MAKAPVAGEVKTRLCPPLSPQEAARVAAAFLLDTWTAARAVFPHTTFLAYAGDLERFPAPLRGVDGVDEVDAVAQRGADLGARIESAIEAGLARGGRVIVVGSDLPGLPPDALREAVSQLERADVCLGPSSDGGFYLIGARRWRAGLLSALPWSAENTAAATEARLLERGYAVAMAPAFDDIDEPAELEALRRKLASDPSPAPHTAAVLEAIGFAG